jgi:hypothetical protein
MRRRPTDFVCFDTLVDVVDRSTSFTSVWTLTADSHGCRCEIAPTCTSMSVFNRHRFLPSSARLGGPSCRDQSACMIRFHCVHILLSSTYRSSELSICISMYRPRRHRLSQVRRFIIFCTPPVVRHSFVLPQLETDRNSSLTLGDRHNRIEFTSDDRCLGIDGQRWSAGVGRTFSLAIGPEQTVSFLFMAQSPVPSLGARISCSHHHNVKSCVCIMSIHE